MDEPKKIGLLDLLIILLERKWFFIISMLLFCAAGVIISMVSAKYYTATAVIMKPEQKLPSGIGSLLGKELPVSGLLKSMDLGGADVDNFLSILQSGRLAGKAVDRFNLVHYYGFDKLKKYYPEDVVKRFHKSVKVTEDKYENIEVSVVDSSPAMAAAVANFIVCELDTITYQLGKESARNSRIFFEDRLALIKRDLDSASKQFTKYQTENNYIELEQQTKSSIEALAQFEAQKMTIDLEIAQLQSQFGASNQRVSELQRQKGVIERKVNAYMTTGGGNLIISLKDAPQKAVQYGYLLRDVKTQEALYEFVLQLYEQAKFSEANNVPTVQVLDDAGTPQKKTRPRRSIICMLFFFVGFALTSTYLAADKWLGVQKQNGTPFYRKFSRARELLMFWR
ncbi:MAG TPA: Wzz/FepE/Etk N-terminal domain-containing protein [Chitinivibrionales bacterium]|nr:Wzz/FepE/Etk N-terminal domain-containing protein [Chitinivibrionales bacterium]